MQNHVQERGAWFRDGEQESLCRTMCRRRKHGLEMVNRSWYVHRTMCRRREHGLEMVNRSWYVEPYAGDGSMV